MPKRLIHARVFLKGSDGKVVARRPGVWSSLFDACQGCGTTERPHMARGLCARCYIKWRRDTNHNGYRDHATAHEKTKRMTEAFDARERVRDLARREARKNDPVLAERRREIANAYTDRHDPVGLGKRVEVAMLDLARFSPTGKRPAPPCTEPMPTVFRGEVVGRGRCVRLVRFATFEEWVPLPRLRTPREVA